MKRLAVVLCPGLLGCALTTAGPGGPLASDTSTHIAATSAMAYGPATATVGGVQVSGNAQSRLAGGLKVNPLPNPVPVTIGVRQQLGTSIEVSGDVGWFDSGLGLRVRLPFFQERTLILSVGARTGAISAFGRPASYQGTVALEAYPHLPGARDGSGHRLVFSLGLAAGAFEHEMSLPSSFELDSDAPHGLPSETLFRPELRLQAAVGVHLDGGDRATLDIALQPWVVLASAAPTYSMCTNCEGPSQLTAFSQSWGLSLLFMPAIHPQR